MKWLLTLELQRRSDAAVTNKSTPAPGSVVVFRRIQNQG
jgi:hypothetical protein